MWFTCALCDLCSLTSSPGCDVTLCLQLSEAERLFFSCRVNIKVWSCFSHFLHVLEDQVTDALWLNLNMKTFFFSAAHFKHRYRESHSAAVRCRSTYCEPYIIIYIRYLFSCLKPENSFKSCGTTDELLLYKLRPGHIHTEIKITDLLCNYYKLLELPK